MEDSKADEQFLALLNGVDAQQPVDAGADVVEIEFPPWFDAERFRRGQQFLRKYLAGAYSGMILGLMSILAIPTIIKVLICTRNSGTAKEAYKRYVETIYHVVAWRDYELVPGSKVWQSLEIVRKKHLNARKHCEKAAQITITQLDMVITQFGFMGYMILRSKSVGIHLQDDSQLADVIYFWRVIGFFVGIKDELNLATDSVSETKSRLRVVLDHFLRPALENPPENFESMTKALTDGLWHYSHYLNGKVCMFMAKRLAGCKGYEYFDSEFDSPPNQEDRARMEYYKCSLFQRFLISASVFIHEIEMKFTIFRWYFNSCSKRLEWTNYYFPWTAMFAYGIKQAFIRIFRSKENIKTIHSE